MGGAAKSAAAKGGVMGGWVSTTALWVMGTALFSSGGTQRSCPRQPLARAEQARLGDLQAKLAQRDAELARVKTQLAELDADSRDYQEAQRTGIVAAVERASSLTPRQQERLATAIVREARTNGLDPLLVVAVIRSESSFNNFAVSGVGAMGLMQMMPDTGSWLAKQRGSTWRSKAYLFDSELNVELGCAYLASLIERFGTVEKALVAYNAGPGLARKILAKRALRRKFVAGYPHKVIAEWHRLQKQRTQLIEALSDAPPATVETALR
jgi:soluble lytic murein transglycosylase